MASNGTTPHNGVGNVGSGGDSDHTPSQRYLSTRGEDTDFSFEEVVLKGLILHRFWTTGRYEKHEAHGAEAAFAGKVLPQEFVGLESKEKRVSEVAADWKQVRAVVTKQVEEELKGHSR
ncbi:hypothetical protein BN1723_004659 [Verticillium longisporum]|uniref:Uncharacterized protein n=1 Tax=Verticillium longisporum TaxID=100787 RepID=A0A0G4N056_VERLO|nr:hypothetical protein BN1723_004659 [Verticillium longisporum]